MGNSMFKGLTGLIMLFAGVSFILSALMGGSFWTIIAGIVGFSPVLCIAYYVFLAIIGIPMIFYGARWFFQNENGLLRLLFGVGGIGLFLVSLVVGLAGSASIIGAPLALVSWIFGMALSMAMINYGFNLKILPFVDAILLRMKKIVTLKI